MKFRKTSIPTDSETGNNDVRKTTDRRCVKRFVRGLLFLCSFTGILIFSAFLFLQTQSARESIIQLIEKAVAENTRASCHIGRLEGNLLSRFEISDFFLKDADTGELLMTADRIAVSYSLPMLLNRLVWVKQLRIEGAWAKLVQFQDEYWNVERLFFGDTVESSASEAETAPYTSVIRELIIRRSSLVMVLPWESYTTTHHFNELECQARLNIGDHLTAEILELGVNVDSPRMDVADLSGDLKYDWDDESLDFIDARVIGQKSDFTINGRLIFLDDGPDAVHMDLRADIRALSLGEFGRIFPVEMPDADIVSGNLSVLGPVSAMDCRVDLQMAALHVESKGSVTINEANDVGLDISGKIQGLDLSLLPVLELDAFPGNLNTDFSLVWNQIGMPAQDGKIFLNLKPSRMWKYALDQATLDLRIDGADFIFDTLKIKSPYGNCAGNLRLDGFMDTGTDNRIVLSADFKELDPQKIIGNKQYAGHLNGNLRSDIFIPKTFVPAALRAAVECRMKASRLMDVDILSGEMKGRWQDEKIMVDDFDMKTRIGSAGFTGEICLPAETCQLHVHAQIPDIKEIRPFLPASDEFDDVSGSIEGLADIDGPWEKPHVTADINGKNIFFQNLSADSITVCGIWDGDAKSFQLSADSVMKNMQYNHFRVSEMNLSSTLTPELIRADLEIQGEQKESLQLSGEIAQWREAEKSVTLDKISLISFDQPPLVNRSPVNVLISSEGLHMEALYLDSGNASLLLTGDAGFTPSADVSAHLTLRDFNLKRISGFWENGDKLHGFLASDILLSGSMENPVMHMRTSIKEVSYDPLPALDFLFTLDYADSGMMLKGSGMRQGKKFLNINGTLPAHLALSPFVFSPRTDGFFADFKVDQMDIAWISDMINHPEYGVTGMLGAEVSLAGDFAAPRIQGRAQLSGGTLRLKKQALVYEKLTADLSFENQSVIIDDISIEGDKEGSLHLSGGLTHHGFIPRTFDIQAKGRNLYIPFHSGVDARIQPDLTLSGTWAAPVVKGKIKVSEGRVNLERFFEKKASEIQVISLPVVENGVLQIPDKEPESLKFIDPLTADVNVIVPKNFWFKGKDEFIEIKGNIQLKKEFQKPFVLYGAVFPVRGTYRFQGRVFHVDQGEVTFAGQTDINPLVNIEAFTLINEVKIIVRLSGSFERLNLVFDSEPAMDQSAIISYLVFGRGPDDLSDKESFQAEEAALSFTGQIAADKLRDIIGDTFGIDYLNISTGSGGLRNGSLTMGKYVLPRVFVTFRQGFDKTATQKVEVTYEINKNFELETRIDNEQTSAVDLIWKYEF